jgi:hypothetical protein
MHFGGGIGNFLEGLLLGSVFHQGLGGRFFEGAYGGNGYGNGYGNHNYQNPMYSQWIQNQYRQPTNYPLPNLNLDPIDRDAAIVAREIGNGQTDLRDAQRFLEKAARCDRYGQSHGRQPNYYGRLVAAVNRDLQSSNPRYQFVADASTSYRPRIVDTQSPYYQNNNSSDDDSTEYS